MNMNTSYRGGQHIDPDANTRSVRGPPHSSQAASIRGNPPPPQAALTHQSNHQPQRYYGSEQRQYDDDVTYNNKMPRSQAASVTSNRSPRGRLYSPSNVHPPHGGFDSAPRSPYAPPANGSPYAPASSRSYPTPQQQPQGYHQQQHYPAPPHPHHHQQQQEPQYPPPHVLYDSDIGSTADEGPYTSSYPNYNNGTNNNNNYSPQQQQYPSPTHSRYPPSHQQQQQQKPLGASTRPAAVPQLVIPGSQNNRPQQQQQQQPSQSYRSLRQPAHEEDAEEQFFDDDLYDGGQDDRPIVEFGEEEDDVYHGSSVPQSACSHRVAPAAATAPSDAGSQYGGNDSVLGQSTKKGEDTPRLKYSSRAASQQVSHHQDAAPLMRASTRSPTAMMAASRRSGSPRALQQAPSLEDGPYGGGSRSNNNLGASHWHDASIDDGYDSDLLVERSENGTQTVYQFHKVKRNKRSDKRSASPQSTAPHTNVPNLEPRQGSQPSHANDSHKNGNNNNNSRSLSHPNEDNENSQRAASSTRRQPSGSADGGNNNTGRDGSPSPTAPNNNNAANNKNDNNNGSSKNKNEDDESVVREGSVTQRRKWRDDSIGVPPTQPTPMPIFVLQRPKAKYFC